MNFVWADHKLAALNLVDVSRTWAGRQPRHTFALHVLFARDALLLLLLILFLYQAQIDLFNSAAHVNLVEEVAVSLSCHIIRLNIE